MLKLPIRVFLCRPSSWNHRTKCQEIVKRFFFSKSPGVVGKNHDQSLLGSSVVVTGVFPDDSASAAGVRTRFLLEKLAQQAQESTVILTTTTTDKDYWTQSSSSGHHPKSALLNEQEQQHWIPNLKVEHLPMNRSDAVEDFLSKHHHEGIIERIIFDRFYIEEAFSHSFWEQGQNNNTNKCAAMILDMQDMHSLRHGRQELVRRLDHHHQAGRNNNNKGKTSPGGGPQQEEEDPLQVISKVMDYLPTVNGNGKDTDRLLRELASIHRCDLTLVCSPYEMDLLQKEYGVPKDKLCLASFFVDPSSIIETKNLIEQERAVPNDDDEETKFIFCGGFLHDPNVDAVQVLLKNIWPRLQSMVDDDDDSSSSSKRILSLHIHGAYCPESILKAHNPQNGIFVHGYTPRLEDIFDNTNNDHTTTTAGRQKKILLAPLRFGAGIKGKIIDAWRHGVPVVTTPIGSEGIIVVDHHHQKDHPSCDNFGGAVCSTVDDFCENAIGLMNNVGGCYSKAQKDGFRLLQTEFHADRNWETVQQHLQALQHPNTLTERRRRDPIQAMLWHQSLRSTKYFSKWIEEKETKV